MAAPDVLPRRVNGEEIFPGEIPFLRRSVQLEIHAAGNPHL